MIDASALDAYRLLRRLLLVSMPKGPRDNPNLNEPEFVEMFMGRIPSYDRNHNQGPELIKATAKRLGLPRRELQEYAPDEWRALAAEFARNLASEDTDLSRERAAKWPSWPDGWQDSLARAKKNA